MTTLLRVLLIALLALALPATAQVYKWVDKDGKVQYTEFPPPKDAKNVSEKSYRGGGPSSEEQVPYATRVASQRHPVTLYVSTQCGDYCDQGRALLSKRGVPFAEKNAQADQAAQDTLMKLAGSLAVPFLRVGESNVHGFDEGAWNSALDRAGYARTRLPGQPGPQAEQK
jgi:glutaredoxin